MDREVDYKDSQISTIKSEIKSKISIAESPTVKNMTNFCSFKIEDGNFTFYDEKVADNESKIFELRQW